MLNLITLQGRLTADPEIKTMPSGKKLVQVTIACPRPKSRDAEEVTDFIPAMAWEGRADFITNYFHKGDNILVTGRLQSRNYEGRDGKKHTAYEVSISEVNFCGGRSTAAPQQAQKPKTQPSEDDVDWDSIPDIPFDEF